MMANANNETIVNGMSELIQDGKTVNRKSNSEDASVAAQIQTLCDEIRQLKTIKADPLLIKERMRKLLELKSLLGDDFKYSLKCPKGTKDYGPAAMVVREKVLKTITDCFKRHGAETIDTPVFELKDTLLGKYGEEGGKLVYDLADQGGELLSLRYDLTVPFARYLAMNKISNMKRYQIAKVYRRDNPAMTRGRYREFYQCDFDIAGQYDPLIPESECLRVTDEVLNALGLVNFEIKINHRLLLDGIFEVCGVAEKDFRTVCSSIDKLDKVDWQTISQELTNDKYIKESVVDSLQYYVRITDQNKHLSNEELISLLENDNVLAKNKSASKALSELRLLLEYSENLGIQKRRLVFEPSLARGLDYYTGVIFEVVLEEYARLSGLNAKCESGDDSSCSSLSVGSVAAGGRYDKLVGMFSVKNKDVPCVGISFGIERLLRIMESKAQMDEGIVRVTETEVFVASAQKGLLVHRMKLCRQLWDANIKAEMPYKLNAKLLNQLQFCEDKSIPLAVIVGESELQRGLVKIRDVQSRQESEIALPDLVSEVRKRLLGVQIDHLKATVDCE